MKNNKLRYAAFNLRLQMVIVDNWRFLSSVCRVLNLVYGWGEKRLTRWVDSAAEYVRLFNDYDIDGDYRYRLEKLEREQGGEIITRERAEQIVFNNTTLKDPSEISEIVDNLLLELLMTVTEFDGVGRERLMSGIEELTYKEIDESPGYVKDRFGIELDTSFQDYHGILKARGKAEKATLDERKKAGTFLEAFRKWSEEYNPKE
ncbi:MAG: hypothetical protein IKR76_12020 [Ruminococcus sp.]|nr:hypothetical protein [Ruminococcus sp.]